MKQLLSRSAAWFSKTSLTTGCCLTIPFGGHVFHCHIAREDMSAWSLAFSLEVTLFPRAHLLTSGPGANILSRWVDGSRSWPIGQTFRRSIVRVLSMRWTARLHAETVGLLHISISSFLGACRSWTAPRAMELDGSLAQIRMQQC